MLHRTVRSGDYGPGAGIRRVLEKERKDAAQGAVLRAWLLVSRSKLKVDEGPVAEGKHRHSERPYASINECEAG
jgi:hypothetical protein